jgi:alkanesulfonate monooxygenase SsuD/methylene tetrahydromethanopterin reductase-like flavin-dependent oxidoreductase (luciferase family)
MGEENESIHEEDEVVEEVKEELKDNVLTNAQLKALEEKVMAHIHSITRDNTKDAQEKAELKTALEKQSERIEHLINAQEERERKTTDSSTILVPPGELKPATHLNTNEEDDKVQQENQQKPTGKRKMRFW